MRASTRRNLTLAAAAFGVWKLFFAKPAAAATPAPAITAGIDASGDAVPIEGESLEAYTDRAQTLEMATGRPQLYPF